MTTVPDHVSDAFATITARLAARHDALTIVRAVTDVGGAVMAAAATGILVTDPRGGVEVVAASDERARFVELLQAQAEEGPCVACIHENALVGSVDLTEETRWSSFTTVAKEAGFRSVYAFPMRLGTRAVGGLNVLYTERTDLPPADLRLGQALADLAVLGLTQERDERRAERLAEQTIRTLNDRVSIGHAVGMLAGALGLTPDDARTRLYDYAVTTGRPLRELARELADGTLAPDAVVDTSHG